MTMLIIICIGWFALCLAVGYLIDRTVRKVRTKRINIAFANLSREMLLAHANINPVYRSYYANMVCGGVSPDRATKLVTDRMLIDMGLIGYRKAET